MGRRSVMTNVERKYSSMSGYSSENTKVMVSAYIGDRHALSNIDEIRRGVVEFAGESDGVIHQACIDAGFGDVVHRIEAND